MHNLHEMKHPWSLNKFKQDRPEQYHFVADQIYNDEIKFTVVCAPVKSGKRSFPEIASLVRNDAKHIFTTALNRTANSEQFAELEKYGLEVMTVYNKVTADCFVERVNKLSKNNKEIHIHLDELDYGCRFNQLLAGVYIKVRMLENVKFILYSATVDVVKQEFLDKNVEKFKELEFTPHSKYFGIKKYLDQGLIKQATPFFDYDKDNKISLSNQGKECLDSLLNDAYDKNKEQHMGVLRLAGKNEGKSEFKILKENENMIHTYVAEYINNHVHEEKTKRLKNGIHIIYGSSDSKDKTIDWENEKYWTSFNHNIPFLIVICQTAGRSTQWTNHEYLSWFHTCRSDTTTVGTQIQDQERVVYYTTLLNKNLINITIYGDVPCARYSSGDINFEELTKLTDRNLSGQLNHKCVRTVKVEMKPYEVYEKWEYIPSDIRGKRKETNYINHTLKLQQYMCYDKTKNGKKLRHIVEVPEWHKYETKGLNGKYICPIRNYHGKFIQHCCNVENGIKSKLGITNKLIWTRSDLEKELAVGIGRTNPVRISVFYEDYETDPEKYKFMVRKLDKVIPVKKKNDSMYNTKTTLRK